MKRFWHGPWWGAWVAALLGFSAPPAAAQLISPGKLSAAHASLEGLANCTSCHVLGAKGASNEKCLACHTPLDTRIRARKGFHATVARESCASCHKEHFGRDFDLTHFDAPRFDHRKAGFALVGSHARLDCQTCHTPALVVAADVKAYAARHGTSLARTFLGLGTTCQSCHAADNPHGDQFAEQACQACHAQDTWKGAARFSHARTRFPLVGLHRQVACESCHHAPPGQPAAAARYAGTASATCQACHEDPHRGAMGAACQGCHSPAGWQQINRPAFEQGFNHAQTGFALVGAHAALACASCHARPARRTDAIALTFQPGTAGAAYPPPVAEACTSCHLDYHGGAFEARPGGAACQGCHSQQAWLPAQFDLARHNRDTAFPLTGAHQATPCVACHHNPALGQTRPTFHFASTACQGCHGPDNPHGDQFASSAGATICQDCHTTSAWTVIASFDHARTGFPLTGAHGRVACAGCHTPPASQGGPRVFRGLPTACASCHADPHRGQFDGQTCASCHDTASFHVAAFDHSQTRFPLTGAHVRVACAACHHTEHAPDGTPFTRFKPLGTSCKDCHRAPP